MKHILPIFCITLGLLHGVHASEVLLEDDFTMGESGPISDRQPAIGSPWQGMAEIVPTVGLVHGGESRSRSAFSELIIPSNAEKLIVTMEGFYEGGGQFAFGFTDRPTGILGEGELNHGLIWVNLTGWAAKLRAGEYASGEFLEAVIRGLKDGDPFELEFTAKILDERIHVPVSLIFNGVNVVAGDILPTKLPSFQNFFISFRGGDDSFPKVTVLKVKVVVE